MSYLMLLAPLVTSIVLATAALVAWQPRREVQGFRLVPSRARRERLHYARVAPDRDPGAGFLQASVGASTLAVCALMTLMFAP